MESEEEREQSNGFHRCKTKDKELHEFPKKLVAEHTTMEKLKEVAHVMDTQINESLNSVVVWSAPKNENHNGSCSLESWMSMALGIHSVGHSAFFCAFVKLMKIKVTPCFDCCPNMQS